MTYETAKRGLRASYASLEMSSSECAGRLLSNASGVRKPTGKGFLNAGHKQKLETQVQAMQGHGQLHSRMITKLPCKVLRHLLPSKDLKVSLV